MPLLSSAKTFGRKRPFDFYATDEIEERASRLPALKSLALAKEREEKGFALQEKGLAQTEDLARLGRESSERIATSRRDLDTRLADATRISNEAIAEKQNILTEAGQSQTKRQNKYGNVISGVGLGLSAIGLASDAGGWGNLISSILDL